MGIAVATLGIICLAIIVYDRIMEGPFSANDEDDTTDEE